MMVCQMLLLIAATTLSALPPTLAGGYTAVCGGASCPSVSWSDSPAGQAASFTLTSSKQSNSNNYVAFAFATDQTMGSAQVVVDCYDVNGIAMMGTSRNSASHTNQASSIDAPKVSNRNATSNQGVLACAFNMALPNASAFILIAEGTMDATVSPAVKTYHNGRYPSSVMYSFAAPASTSTSGATTAATMAATAAPTAGAITVNTPVATDATSPSVTSSPSITGGASASQAPVAATSPSSSNATSQLPVTFWAANSTANSSTANSTASVLPAGAATSAAFMTVTLVNARSTMFPSPTPSAHASISQSKNSAYSPSITMDAVAFACTTTSLWILLHR